MCKNYKYLDIVLNDDLNKDSPQPVLDIINNETIYATPELLNITVDGFDDFKNSTLKNYFFPLPEG